MKAFSLLILLVMTLSLGSCGNKNESGSKTSGQSSSTFSQAPNAISTVDGLINVDTLAIQAGGVTYQISKESYKIVIAALNVSYNAGIKTDAQRNLKAKMTGSIIQGHSVQSGYQGGAYNVLNITEMVVYP